VVEGRDAMPTPLLDDLCLQSRHQIGFREVDVLEYRVHERPEGRPAAQTAQRQRVVGRSGGQRSGEQGVETGGVQRRCVGGWLVVLAGGFGFGRHEVVEVTRIGVWI